MPDEGVIQPSSREIERLNRVDVAARAYVDAQEAIWRHRQTPPENDKGCTYWIAERDELANQVEEAIVALVSEVRRG